jgi:hypothetical protein
MRDEMEAKVGKRCQMSPVDGLQYKSITIMSFYSVCQSLTIEHRVMLHAAEPHLNFFEEPIRDLQIFH